MRTESVNLSGIGPGGKPGDDVELAEKATDDLVGVSGGHEPIELGHHFHECALGVGNRPFRVVLTLLFEAALALDEFLAVEIRNGMENRIALRTRIGQEA